MAARKSRTRQPTPKMAYRSLVAARGRRTKAAARLRKAQTDVNRRTKVYAKAKTRARYCRR